MSKEVLRTNSLLLIFSQHSRDQVFDEGRLRLPGISIEFYVFRKDVKFCFFSGLCDKWKLSTDDNVEGDS